MSSGFWELEICRLSIPKVQKMWLLRIIFSSKNSQKARLKIAGPNSFAVKKHGFQVLKINTVTMGNRIRPIISFKK